MAGDYCVYMHKNKLNGKIYIGQSNNLAVRWHPISYKNCSYFYNAIQKYGWNNFEHIILKNNLSHEEADQLEIEYINKYNTMDRSLGYNLKSGGTNHCALSEDTKRKIKKSNKEYALNHREEIRQRALIGAEKSKKKVICITTGQIFDSQREAAKFAGLNNSSPISACCHGKRKTAGKHPRTQERLQWSFYEKKEE